MSGNIKHRKQVKCGVQTALSIIGGRWKLVIIYFFLKHNSLRFSELKNLMPLISKKVLVSQLRELEADNIILRKAYEDSKTCIKYELTEYGVSLKDIVFSLREWGDNHTKQMSTPL